MNEVLKERRFDGGQLLTVIHGDITIEEVDAIVNPANERLLHGGGLAAIIAKKGGPRIDRESRAWIEKYGRVSHSAPAYTSGGDLSCKYVIHAVGPRWGSGNEEGKLADAVRGSLSLADELNLKSIAFPAIATGIFGFPKDQAARVIYKTIEMYFEDQSTSGLESVHIALFDQPTVDAFLEVWDEFYG